MATAIVSAPTKLGLFADGMSVPRQTRGLTRSPISILAVAFSYFFIHISFFGPPIQEIFKGTFLLGVAVLSILVCKGRQKPLRAGVVWLDELVALLCFVSLGAFLAIWAWWGLVDHTKLWRDIWSPERN